MNTPISPLAVDTNAREGMQVVLGRRGNERLAAAVASAVVSVTLLTGVVVGITGTASEPGQTLLAKR